ncbi:MAG: ATP-dependent sacrificial sulfur transferase LarE [Candidatus Omnitrophica bacterium]|nr:ATP-dependent sacrificial sulfur transferase LarE [Candidatus Omnitrophota bacterium]MBU4473214.1 ATP-dependent sacrificial sulfur transferase LarE [Candidatus Omnitrophota bacterium]MCG2706577.1 ATP-dependent sacrificial sulfur transferase LarE [Candidatus Omnitrophota bacterium]
MENKFKNLKDILKKMGSVLVAYSGGVDSTFLLKVAGDVLEDGVLAVTADSPTYPKEELAFSKRTAKELGIRHKIIKTHELKDRKFTSNTVSRCYFCKKELFSRLKYIARKNKLNFVIDATNVSDKKDFRPGNKARDELNIRSPLQEAGFTKYDIRRLSKKLGLSTWDKPSLACLASRFAYGKKISLKILKRINRGESFLRKQGFKQVRLRHYNGLCRIEVSKNDIPLLLNKRDSIVARLKRIGYKYITVDLQGYRTGSMNEVLKEVKR